MLSVVGLAWMAADKSRKMHTSRRENFSLARSTAWKKLPGCHCRLVTSGRCLFFHWHSACKSHRVRPGVLAHRPLLPTAGAPGTAFPWLLPSERAPHGGSDALPGPVVISPGIFLQRSEML